MLDQPYYHFQSHSLTMYLLCLLKLKIIYKWIREINFKSCEIWFFFENLGTKSKKIFFSFFKSFYKFMKYHDSFNKLMTTSYFWRTFRPNDDYLSNHQRRFTNQSNIKSIIICHDLRIWKTKIYLISFC